MSHTSSARDANLLGTLSLAVSDRLAAAVGEASGQGGAAPAALVALAVYLDGSSIDKLRRPLGLSHSAAVRLIDRLAQAGLVRRERAGDGREVSVKLTAAGSDAAERIRLARERALEAVLEPLDPAGRETLARLHELLLAGLTAGRADAQRLCRLCDAGACGHEEGLCPVTRAADAAEGVPA
jgi:DNA-binding MarR family transcriptional regulator